MWDDSRCHYVNILNNQEEDGRLLVVEGDTNTIPFDIKRIFWVRDVTVDAHRGQHATKQTRLVLIAVTGSCDVEVRDADSEQVYRLDNPTKGLYIDKMLWRTMKNFSEHCVVEAICDHTYAGSDETYDDFDDYCKALSAYCN